MGRTVRPALTQRRATSLACPDVGIFDETRGAPRAERPTRHSPASQCKCAGHRSSLVTVSTVKTVSRWPGGMVLPSVEPSGVVSLFIVP